MSVKRLLKELAMTSLFGLGGISSYFFIASHVGTFMIIAYVFQGIGYIVYRSLTIDAIEESKDEKTTF